MSPTGAAFGSESVDAGEAAMLRCRYAPKGKSGAPVSLMGLLPKICQVVMNPNTHLDLETLFKTNSEKRFKFAGI